jgi:hypothetical protein
MVAPFAETTTAAGVPGMGVDVHALDSSEIV